MIHKKFTISHHSSTYPDYESYEAVRKLTLDMHIKEPSIVFHPSNKYLFPKPLTINNVSEKFPLKEHKFLFHVFRNPKQTKYVFVVTMLSSDIELKRHIKYYLASNKLYMNSPAIDADTPYTVGWIKNLKPKLANFKFI